MKIDPYFFTRTNLNVSNHSSPEILYQNWEQRILIRFEPQNIRVNLRFPEMVVFQNKDKLSSVKIQCLLSIYIKGENLRHDHVLITVNTFSIKRK